MGNNNKLYFVNSIYHDDTEGENGLYYVTLLGTENHEEDNRYDGMNSLVLALKKEELQYDHRGGDIREGWYVKYFPNYNQWGLKFSYGGSNSYAKEQIALNNNLRSELQQLSSSFSDDISSSEIDRLLYKSQVISYHVNVGHGNCSIILIKSNNCRPQIWMVDCSVHEIHFQKTDGLNPMKNLDDCLNAIANETGADGKRLHIDRFFLTHMHYDHYNGMMYLMDKKLIDKKTVFYINLHYQMASKTMNNILAKMKKDKMKKIVEPLVSNGKLVFQILHPESHITRTRTSNKKITPHRVVKKVNNSSTVIRFYLGRQSMVFTGDIEQEGLKTMSNYLPFSIMCRTDYYVVPHHGSINGHLLNCKNSLYPFRYGCFCFLRSAIIMGRDGAYNGIFSQKVINDFVNRATLYTTDSNYNGKPTSYIKIDWQTNYVDCV